MSINVGIVDFGQSGNLSSIRAAIEAAGANVVILTDKDDFLLVDKLVLPGVGAFPDAMNKLKESDLFESLLLAIQTKPTLGICLGMQLLSKVGFEFKESDGLNIIDAEVKPIECHGAVPHMGFSNVKGLVSDPLFDGIEESSFYFMHSYEVVSYQNAIALTEYCGHQFVSAIRKGHVYGVQFHPEKSRDQGIRLFKNFMNKVG